MKQTLMITFEALKEEHLPLLLKWLETPHVKAWWDQDVKWTAELIREKYGTYIEGYKIEEGIRKPMKAYIIKIDNLAIGYIQFYNAHDFNRSQPLIDLPESLAALDIFIGDNNFVNQGIGSAVLKKFLLEYVDPVFKACFVDPDRHNIAAIKAYEKAGFKQFKRCHETNEIWMLRQ